jgi:hypothetical protein
MNLDNKTSRSFVMEPQITVALAEIGLFRSFPVAVK